jgi:hypothetical protein
MAVREQARVMLSGSQCHRVETISHMHSLMPHNRRCASKMSRKGDRQARRDVVDRSEDPTAGCGAAQSNLSLGSS